MAVMSVSLSDSLKEWVEEQTVEGDYMDSSDYVCDLIRKDKARQKAERLLQAAITEGVESGEPQEFDVTAFKLKMRERYAGN
ncbi:addiction module antitoxin [Thalassospira profundimaris]|uniref:Addiction module antitoxin n=1 Tax=Thalassospira profundimaris TaxID=502049 RepID=A0A367XNB2_9PROT|nr:type II toxin-antitoxin system ParD family antitoxin [Thalassospira profundimaris]RCK54311.1 addiction module antitoxin [Thalassospira profundimaris]